MSKNKSDRVGLVPTRKNNPRVAAIYPDGIHETIARLLRSDAAIDVSTAWLDRPEHGLGGRKLEEADRVALVGSHGAW
jgi:trehalose utilization protein